jgi:hypothetical protein
VGGLGVELRTRWGLSLSTDLQFGPEERVGRFGDSVLRWGRSYRLGLGFGF